MSISNSDKQYFIGQLTKELESKIVHELAQAGSPTLLEDIRNEAKQKILLQIGMTMAVDRINDINEAVRVLDEEKEKLRREKDGLNEQIKEAIMPLFKRVFPGHNTWNWSSMLDEIAETQFLTTLREQSEIGAKVADYFDAINGLERTIMLATSSTQLKTFLARFAAKFGIDLGDEDLV